MNKTLIIGTIACILLITPTVSVLAGNTQLFTDDKNDVMDAMSMTETDIARGTHADNIDIREITYHREGKTVTLTMRVKGEIENIGNIGDLEKIFGQRVEVTAYTLILSTTNDTYLITYTNNICNMPYGTNGTYENIDLPTTGNTLTISFDLTYDNENVTSIEALNTYSKMPSFAGAENMSMSELMALTSLCKQYMDEFATDITDNYNSEIDDEHNNDESNDKTESSSNANLIYFFGVIITISIVGIAIVIYIVRR